MINLFITLGILSCIFVIVQTRTLFFERNYPIATFFLLTLSLVSTYLVLRGWALSDSVSRFFILTISFFISGLTTFLLVAKLIFRDNWLQDPRRLLRTPTKIDEIPHKPFNVKTSDGITIRGYLISSENRSQNKKVVIIAHGGFRSKDMLVKVIMAAWLRKYFDVIAFDFRGHGESGGVWTGDGVTVKDLRAVVNFAKEEGYEKVGVFGRSMGGWTAILAAADEAVAMDEVRNIDALVVAGMPPNYYSEVPAVKGKIHLLKIPGSAWLFRVFMGVRFKFFKDNRSALNEIGKITIPILVLYNQADPNAGVAGEKGYWEAVPPKLRSRSSRTMDKLPFSAEDIFKMGVNLNDKSRLDTLRGVGHVYSLLSLRELFELVEDWFLTHLQ